MISTRKEKTINGEQYIYSEQLGKYLPVYKTENGMKYKLDSKTMTYIPLIAADEQEDYSLGVWGKRRLNFLKEERPILYDILVMDGLWAHLVSVDKKADEMEDSLLEEMSAAEGVNAEMKLKDHLEWAARRNGIKNRVHEIIYNELIYA